MVKVLTSEVYKCLICRYFEAEVEHIEKTTKSDPVLRIGWANTAGFKPFPGFLITVYLKLTCYLGSGDGWGCCAAGDDFYSFAFDGI